MKKSITKQDVVKTVKVTKRGATVQSDRVAKVFGKSHKQVLALIDKKIKFLTANSISRQTYFLDSKYINSRGKEYRRFELSRKGFDLIVLSFKGDKAELYRIWYIDEFHKKSDFINKNKQLAYDNNENPIYLELREISKEARTKLTDAINDYLLPQREAEGKETAQFVTRYITSYTKLIYKKLGIEVPKGIAVNRDALSVSELGGVQLWETVIAETIKGLAYNDVHYKKIYQHVKDMLLR